MAAQTAAAKAAALAAAKATAAAAVSTAAAVKVGVVVCSTSLVCIAVTCIYLYKYIQKTRKKREWQEKKLQGITNISNLGNFVDKSSIHLTIASILMVVLFRYQILQ